MMHEEPFELEIDWLAAGLGGRPNGPPRGRVYFATVAFDSSPDTTDISKQYSIRVELDEAGRSGVAEFLVSDPSRLKTRIGMKLLILEGSRVVARGVVVHSQ